MAEERIVSVGLLTRQDVEVLGQGFTRLWPVDDNSQFGELLHAIDQADREIWRARDAGGQPDA